MHRTLLILLLILFSIKYTTAQVINAEKKRKGESGQGWEGNVDLGLSYTKNTKEILQLTSRANVQWTKENQTVLLLSDLRLMSVNQSNIQNRGFQHARYNYEFRPYLIPEAFIQAQYNQLWKIDLRVLAGAGPRFRILNTDSSRIYLGTLLMYEYENIADSLERNRDLRLSSYLSTGFAVNDRFRIDHITYYQPKVNLLSDFRISSETVFKFFLTTRLAFKTTFSINYDSRPPDGLENTFISWSNSLSFNF